MDDERKLTTEGPEYAALLERKQLGWKQRLDVYRIYRWNLARMQPGRLLDVGCGIGRNLIGFPDAVGVDHNSTAVAVARGRGLTAYTTDEWPSAAEAVLGTFDTLLVAHVLEHLLEDAAVALLREYLGYLKPVANLVIICPQERAYSKDPTHVRWMAAPEMARVAQAVGFEPIRGYSFPFFRPVGRIFNGNETVLLSRRSSA